VAFFIYLQVLYDVVLFFVDRLFVDRAIERFWFLETVARIPYFSYVTCLHLYETLGWWRTGIQTQEIALKLYVVIVLGEHFFCNRGYSYPSERSI
jgi:hypothetical protein